MLKKFASSSLKLVIMYILSVTIVSAVLIGSAFVLTKGDIGHKGPRVTIKDHEFFLDIADTEEEREQGLSGYGDLEPYRAMLFKFEAPGQYCFWMKDMNFPIDIVWLNSDKQVVYVKENARPESYPDQYCPEKSASYVLEFTAGTTKGMKLRSGDQAYLNL